MSFSQFKTIGDVQSKFGIRFVESEFVDAAPVTPPPQFLEEFEFNRRNFFIFSSEGARCETVIFPILRENYKPYADGFAMWVQQPFSADPELNGTPDYLIATRSELGKSVVGTPVVIVIEAKKNDFEVGWGQCLGEMYAAQKINDDDRTLYGIVTDGERWQFGKLSNSDFLLNTASFTIDDLPELFGAIRYVFDAACGQLQETTPA